MNSTTPSALVFDAPFDLRIRAVPARLDLGEFDVRVATELSLISPGTELALYTGTHVGIPDPANKFAKFPFKPGYASVGTVLELGQRVHESMPELRLGDMVYTLGGHSQVNIVATNDVRRPVMKVPDGVLPQQAVFARLAAISMTAVIQSRPVVGDTAIVLGMGLIGNLAAQLMTLAGANVAVVDLVAQRLDVATRCGLNRAIVSGDNVDLKAELHRLLGAPQADIVIEATGSPKLVVPALQMARSLGQVIALGSTRGNVDVNVYEHIHRSGVRFSGAHENLQYDSHLPTRQAITQYVMHMLSIGALKVEPLVTHRLKWSDARAGYEMLMNPSSGALGVLLDWRDDTSASGNE